MITVERHELIVPELLRLEQDLGLVRDAGRFEEARRLYLDLYGESASDTVMAIADSDLPCVTFIALGHVDYLLAECRRRGMLG